MTASGFRLQKTPSNVADGLMGTSALFDLVPWLRTQARNSRAQYRRGGDTRRCCGVAIVPLSVTNGNVENIN